MNIIRWTEPDFEEKIKQISYRNAIFDAKITKVVESIIKTIKREGDRALVKYAKLFDKVDLQKYGLRVSQEEITQSVKLVPSSVKKAITIAEKNIILYAKSTLRRDWYIKNYQGGYIGEKFDPFERVGIYVPGGKAPLISTMLMTALLAKVAGCKEIVACTPCDPNGKVHPAILYAAQRCGISELYRIGGAQAIAAMALGTQSIRPVQKIFGPGNAYVVSAKRLLFGYVSIDLLPGPSELLIVADESAPPSFIAADLLAQAEHGSGYERIWLITCNETLATEVTKQIEKLLPALPRVQFIKKVLKKNSWIIILPHLDQAPRIINQIAPEHCQLLCSGAKTLMKEIKTVGAIFIGNWTPTSIGDYIAGPSHTLPTGGAGRSFSGLSADQFQRRTSIIQYGYDALKKSIEPLTILAELEGLHTHAISAKIRLEYS